MEALANDGTRGVNLLGLDRVVGPVLGFLMDASATLDFVSAPLEVCELAGTPSRD